MGFIKGKSLISPKELKEVEKRLCEIYANDMTGTGFFCIIPLNESENLKVLITANHIIGKDDKEIIFSLKNDNEKKRIILDENRIKYTNVDFDITIIEIRENDGIENQSFFEIDEILGEIINYKNYIEIFLLFFSDKKEIIISSGLIEEIINEKTGIIHSCNSGRGTQGGPLINPINKKVIGIHIGALKERNYNFGIVLEGPIEELKNIIKNKKKIYKTRTIPQKIQSLEKLKQKYKIKEKIFESKEYTLYSAFLISGEGQVTIKEYNDTFSLKLYNYIKDELEALCKMQSKFIIELKEYYFSEHKTIFVFSYFQNILKNNKKEYSLETIEKFLIQINEIIKELDKNGINDFVFSPENICLHNQNLILINLFPFYKFLKNGELKLESESLNYIDFKIKNFDKMTKILWNIGNLIYEMHFGELPYAKYFYLNSKSDDFNYLINKLLDINNNKFTWNDYINCEFLNKISPQKKIMYLYDKIVDNSTKGIDLNSSEISEDNLQLLSKMKLDNLFWIILSNNKITNIEFIKYSFKNLKFLILENNNIKNLSLNETLPFNENLEYLNLGSNSIEDIYWLSKSNLISLTHLSLYNNKINDISALKKCFFPSLETLNLSYNQIKNISYLDKVKIENLTNLYLNNNEISDINVFQKIFPLLEILNLENNKIYDINVFNRVQFKNNIKELYLDNNPISKFEKLHLCYFPSIKQITLPIKSENLLLLSTKMKLYGYEIDEEENFSDKMNNSINTINTINIDSNDESNKISVLFINSIYSNNIYKNIQYLNNKNTFKIITNENVDKNELVEFFNNTILEIPKEKFKENNIFFETKYEKDYGEFSNYSIVFYTDKKDIVKKTIKSNVINLADEYEKSHEINEKYNKVPEYLDKTPYYEFYIYKCPLSTVNKEYYKSIPYIIIDKKYELSELLKKNDYHQRLPLLFINSKYYDQFKKFLEFYSKYQNYKKYNEIFIKYFLIQYNKEKIEIQNEYQLKYLHNHKNNIFAEVVENINYYEMEEVYKIINKIQKENINYKKVINNWIIIIFDAMTDFILFILKKTPSYLICPNCKNPLLFINENKNIKNSKEEDPFLYKSLKFSNFFLEQIKENTYENHFDNYIKMSNKNNLKKIILLLILQKNPNLLILFTLTIIVMKKICKTILNQK